jgi:hypothetical protein
MNCRKACLQGLVLSLGCVVAAFGQTTTITYSPSNEVFPNPERGFYVMSWATESAERGDRVFSVSTLRNYRTASNDATKGAHVSLVRRIYYLTSYISKPIDSALLNRIQNDCSIVRQAGLKLVITFAYSDGGSFGSSDAPLSKMLQDLAALESTFRANADVIATFQAGFIGIYGEWWGSSNNLGADWGYGITGYGHSDTTAQRQFLQRYLSVIPATRTIMVRVPRVKRFIWGTTPLPLSRAFDGSEEARIGHYNDAFAVTWDDYGTYDGLPNHGNYADTSVMKPYIAAESNTLPNMAETDDFTSFTTGSKVLAEMARLHMSSENCDYYLPATDSWRADGSFGVMDQKLGYRFQLGSATIGTSASAGGPLRVKFTVSNVGYASPYNPRGLELILRNISSGSVTALNLLRSRQAPYDPRYWFAGTTVTVDTTVTLPSALPEGTYEALLNLPDPVTALHDRSEYSIQLANTNVWEPSTGYNNLHATVSIGAGGGTSGPQAPVAFAPSDGTLGVPTVTTVSWHPSAGAWRYHVQVSDDSLFSTFVVNDSTLVDTLRQVGTLGTNRIYFWRVRALGETEESCFCMRLKFTTVDLTAPSGTLTASPTSLPPGGGSVQLTWTSAHADSASIDQGIGRVGSQGSVSVSVKATTTYTLTLYGQTALTVNATVTVQGTQSPVAPLPISPAEGSMTIPLTTRASWHPSPGATGYHLQLSDDSLFSTFVVNDSTLADTSRQVSGLGMNRIYFWRVRAKNAAGPGAFCPRVKFTTVDVPSPSGNLTAAPGTLPPGGGDVTLTWTSANADSASINQGIGRVGLQGSRVVTVGTTKTFTLTLYGQSQRTYGATVTVQGLQVPGVPVAVSPSEGSVNVPLSSSMVWRPSAGATQYHLQVSDDSLFSTFAVNDSTVADSSLQVTGLDKNRIYFWRVRARNAAGASSYCARIKFTTTSQGGKSKKQRIALSSGWNMISSNVVVSGMTVESLASALEPSLVIIKDGDGAVYWPALGINTLGQWNIRQGYQVCLSAADTLDLTGETIAPESTPVSLSQGWNLIPYFRTSDMNVEDALGSVLPSLVIIKDHFGNVYWPNVQVNSLGSLQPGEGYQVFVSQAADLVYPANDSSAASQPKVSASGPAHRSTTNGMHYTVPWTNTGSSAILRVVGADLRDGDEVAVWTASTMLVGAGVVLNHQAVLTLWGDDAVTSPTVEGALAGESLTLTRWSRGEGQEDHLSVTEWTDVLSSAVHVSGLVYTRDGVVSADVAVQSTSQGSAPQTYALEQNYPNPFNPSTVVSYSLPKDSNVKIEIFNALGQSVRVLIDGEQTAGKHSVLFQALDLASGVYYCSLHSGSFAQSRRMMLLK